MPRIAVTCTHCGKKSVAPSEAAGRMGKCPHCGHKVPVPPPARQSVASACEGVVSRPRPSPTEGSRIAGSFAPPAGDVAATIPACPECRYPLRMISVKGRVVGTLCVHCHPVQGVCPVCGGVLRTAVAQQCRCGAQWRAGNETQQHAASRPALPIAASPRRQIRAGGPQTGRVDQPTVNLETVTTYEASGTMSSSTRSGGVLRYGDLRFLLDSTKVERHFSHRPMLADWLTGGEL